MGIAAKIARGKEVVLFRCEDGSIRVGLADSIREGETRIDHAGFDLRCRMNDVLKMQVMIYLADADVALAADQVTYHTTWLGKRYRLIEEGDKPPPPAVEETQKGFTQNMP